MHTYIVRGTIEQHTHCLLGTPHSFVLIVHLDALFLSLYLKDEELCRAISYFSTLCHILITFCALIYCDRNPYRIKFCFKTWFLIVPYGSESIYSVDSQSIFILLTECLTLCEHCLFAHKRKPIDSRCKYRKNFWKFQILKQKTTQTEGRVSFLQSTHTQCVVTSYIVTFVFFGDKQVIDGHTIYIIYILYI